MARSSSHHSVSRAARGFTLIFLVCFGLIAAALYLQHVKNLDPCPWCVVQRLGYIVIGVLALLAALHRPRGFGIGVYGGLSALVAATGAAAAAYQIYLQADKERAMSCAGSFVERLLDKSAIGKLIPPVLQYDGPCTLKPWSLLGLSIPEWSLVWFLILLVAAIVIPFRARR